jgi:hypothetical protein
MICLVFTIFHVFSSIEKTDEDRRLVDKIKEELIHSCGNLEGLW